jgi:signal transduction histidine kinase
VETPASLEMTGDRDRLEQVLNNLLSNAIRYSPKGGPIGVELALADGFVTLAVSDRGVGIPKDKQALIFERFGRAHGSRYGGLGLGLTISSGIVHQHGGHIEVESSGVDGEGSTFRVRLPLL